MSSYKQLHNLMCIFIDIYTAKEVADKHEIIGRFVDKKYGTLNEAYVALEGAANEYKYLKLYCGAALTPDEYQTMYDGHGDYHENVYKGVNFDSFHRCYQIGKFFDWCTRIESVTAVFMLIGTIILCVLTIILVQLTIKLLTK